MTDDGSADPSQRPGFAPKVPILVDWSRYRIKTVDSKAELEAALRLRHDVFYRELLGQDANRDRLDRDEFDDICDHLVIIDQRSGDLIATYRFNSSALSNRFYTATEFDLGPFLAREGTKLEMGRACIRPDFRTGFTFIALWKGLAAYIQAVPTNYLFGCSSIKTTDVDHVARICDYLERQGHFDPELALVPRPEFLMPGLEEAWNKARSEADDSQDEALRAAVPPLLWAYIDAGATVCGAPALDRDFRCVDFLTVCDLDHLREDLVRKYKPW